MWHWTRAWLVDPGKRRRDIFLRVAFATRYGHCGYAEAMEMPIDDLTSYCDALSTIVQEEQRPLESARRRG